MPTSRRRGTKRRSRQEVERVVQEFRRSGLERTAFAESIGVHVNTLYKWLRQEPNDEAPGVQVAVPVLVRAKTPSADSPPVLDDLCSDGDSLDDVAGDLLLVSAVEAGGSGV